MSPTTDYRALWLRWLSLTTLDHDQSRKILTNLHNEVKAGCELIGKTATGEIARIAGFSVKDTRFERTFSLAVSSAYGGYFLFLLKHNIDPEAEAFAQNTKTETLGAKWVREAEKRSIETYIGSLDPITLLMLDKISDIRLEQLIASHPDLAKLPYETIIRVQQQIAWCTYQGYVLGHLEQKLSAV